MPKKSSTDGTKNTPKMMVSTAMPSSTNDVGAISDQSKHLLLNPLLIMKLFSGYNLSYSVLLQTPKIQLNGWKGLSMLSLVRL